MKRYGLTFFILLLASFYIYSQNAAQILVADPDQPWRQSPATIEEVTYVIKPQGIYSAVDLYMTISNRDFPLSVSRGNLEVLMDLYLPEETIVYDSWLWVEDDIIQADILDRWSASNIYEEIVGRRLDPSLLTKLSDGVFHMDIFPLPVDGSRRIKISFLLPTRWTNSNVITDLPLGDIIQTVMYRPEKLFIRAKMENEWTNPTLLNNPQYPFVQEEDDNRFWNLDLSEIGFDGSLLFATDNPMENGIYANRSKTEDIYQLVLLPWEAFGLEETNVTKVNVLINFESGNHNMFNKASLVQSIKEQLLQSLSPRDSFNVMLSNLNIEPVSPKWIAATPQNIEQTFQSLSIDDLTNYSNMLSLLSRSIQFINENGGNGEMLLFSNSGSEGTVNVANSIVKDMIDLMGDNRYPIHVCDYQNQQFNYYFINNRNYAGNEYLYTNLTRLTGGGYTSLINCCKTFDDIASTLFEEVTALNGFFELHTTLEEGITYNKFNIGGNSDLTDLNKPIYELGRFKGDFPFQIEAAAIIDDNLYQDQANLDASFIRTNPDSMTREIFVGNQLFELEKKPQTNANITEIIDLSIQERVLSLYTAFLALEPALGGTVCNGCVDESEGVTTDVENTLPKLKELKVYPNPFRERVTIEMNYEGDIQEDHLTMGIYNQLGQKVKHYSTSALPDNGAWSIQWDGKSDNGDQLVGGIYFFIIKSNEGQRTVKLVYLN